MVLVFNNMTPAIRIKKIQEVPEKIVIHEELKDKNKDICACSMLDSEQEKDLIDAYEIKEILYRISSYVQAKNLGYNDVLVSYSELKDIEYIISLYDDNNLEDLISKYL